ncbi:MAG: SUMF1/EgtB/PvdO family nonheme iron enzyme [Chthoniobacter sp.]|nr:SUMF1/EgtB/PvdO family nonheme iron enzyme [Chthoniobacter sp.]
MNPKYLLPLILLALVSPSIYADVFGSGANTFNMGFVPIGDAGNLGDASNPSGPAGAVSYTYRMAVTTVSQDMIDKATAAGLTNVSAGPWTGSQPATNLTWYEAAAFVNWLNTSTGHTAAYNLDLGAGTFAPWAPAQAWQIGGQNLFRHKDAYYFLPSYEEWYKAAFYNGTTYTPYATLNGLAPNAVESGTDPNTAVYGRLGQPAAVDQSGGLSHYGTQGQTGNVYQWTETTYDGRNDTDAKTRIQQGGSYYDLIYWLQSSYAYASYPADSGSGTGLRVASIVPEPASAVLLLSGCALLALRRRRN